MRELHSKNIFFVFQRSLARSIQSTNGRKVWLSGSDSGLLFFDYSRLVLNSYRGAPTFVSFICDPITKFKAHFYAKRLGKE